MSTANVDIQYVQAQYSSCKQLVESMRSTSRKLKQRYSEAGRSWRDDLYTQLGAIIAACCESLDRTVSQIELCLHSLNQVIAAINEYEAVNFGSAAGSEGAYGGSSSGHQAGSSNSSMGASGASAASSSVARFTGLSSTQAGQQTWDIGGTICTVYNTPYETAQSNAIVNQGSAFPNLITGTCGCCASGTLMNMAGFNYSESDVVVYAYNHQLCSWHSDPGMNGGTSPTTRQALIEGLSGITCTDTTGRYSLEELAEQVETGHGVIIGVDASGLPGYENCGPGSGHAVVLASTARNAETNEIEGYYIFDSNGTTAAGAPGTSDVCQYVPAETLTDCFDSWGRRSNVTEQIIR